LVILVFSLPLKSGLAISLENFSIFIQKPDELSALRPYPPDTVYVLWKGALIKKLTKTL
jgi:hypothetical protein